MIKKIILIILIAGLLLGAGYYFGQMKGYKQGMAQAALNISAAKRLEMSKVEAQKPSGPNSESVLRAIAGKWQSVDDAKLVREFTASSTFSDYRSNKKVLAGTASVFSAVNPDTDAQFKIENGVAYLKVRALNSEYADFFRLHKITATDLELTVIEEGLITQKKFSYKKVK